MGRHTSTAASDVQGMTLTPRVFAGILGAIAILAAVAFFTSPVSSTAAAIWGCGSITSPKEQITDIQSAACDNAYDSRKAWTIPVGLGGVVLLAGAVFIRPGRPVGSADQS
jgi:hypothetical protein